MWFVSVHCKHLFPVHLDLLGGKRQASPLTEGFADVGDGLEDTVGEVDLDLHVLHVGQLQAQELVLRREEQPGVRLDAVLVQCPVGFQQPGFLLLPPQSVVRPVLLHI